MRENSMKSLIKLSFGEEIGNAVSHGVGAAIILILIPIVAIYSYNQGGVIRAAGVSAFTISIFLMLLASTLYHSMAFDSKHKLIFRILDHIFIYVAIAGSYTPIALVVIQGWQGYLILIVQWFMVLIGILYKSISSKEIPKLSLTIYLIMGWTAILFIPSLLANASSLFLFLIVLGGVLYSIGAYFYTRKNQPYAHFIWHLFILAASVSHFIAIVFYL